MMTRPAFFLTQVIPRLDCSEDLRPRTATGTYAASICRTSDEQGDGPKRYDGDSLIEP
jgi:hypothetical protein